MYRISFLSQPGVLMLSLFSKPVESGGRAGPRNSIDRSLSGKIAWRF